MFRKLSASSSVLLAFIFLLSLSLRGPVVGIAPILDLLQTDLDLPNSALGLLTSLPLLCFAIFAPVASWLGHRQGIEKTLLLSALLILCGILLRSIGALSGLYSGVIFIGAGIAISNVLLPILLKRDFQNHIFILTAIYVLMMNLGGALMAGSVIPISLLSEHWFGDQWPSWSTALASQALFVLLPIFLWFKLPNQQTDVPPPRASRPVWRSPIAWLLAMFLALNSVINYTVNTWIPTILIAKNFSPVTAGLYQGYIQIAGVIPALILPLLQRFFTSKRQLSILSVLTTLLALFGFTVYPAGSLLWSICFGFGTTLGFIVGLSFISLRTGSLHEASALSGMAQLTGYLLAAAGPVLIGSLFDAIGDWQIPLYFLIGLCLIWTILGWYASPED